MRFLFFAVTLSATLLFVPLAYGAGDPRGYTPQDAATVAALPIEVVIGPSRVEPQLAEHPVELPYFPTNQPSNPSLTGGQNLAANAIGNAVAAGIIGAIITKGQRDDARKFNAKMKEMGCHFDVAQSIGATLTTAAKAAWPLTSIRTTLSAQPRNAAALLDNQKPRLVFQVSTGVAADYSALLTTVDIDAYPAMADSSVATPVPAWHDSFILVTDQHHVLPRTPEQIEGLIAQENARYEALNLGPTIAMLNKDANEGEPLRHKDEYKRVNVAMEQHRTFLMTVHRTSSPPVIFPFMHREWMLANHCEHFDEAVAQSSTLLRDAIAMMASGQLPPIQGSDPKHFIVTETPGQRSMFALPGGVFVSRRGGDNVPLNFRYSYLAPETE